MDLPEASPPGRPSGQLTSIVDHFAPCHGRLQLADLGTCMRSALLIVIVASGLLSACAPRLPEVSGIESQRPEGFPEQDYRRAAAQGRAVYRVDSAASLVTIEVHRSGSLARLAHDHVVASHDVHGYVLPEAQRADLYVALDRLVVDEPGLRTQAGFDTELPVDAIAGTRRNMLEKVLEVERFPFVLVQVRRVDDRASAVDASITLHGVTRDMQIPAQIKFGAAAVDVTGEFPLAQTDFGIVPLSVLGGAVQVQDRIDLRFRIHASGPE